MQTHPPTHPHPHTLSVSHTQVPRGLYFLGLSVAWVPHFVVLLLANNPFRDRRAYLVTVTGLLAEHCVAGVSMYVSLYASLSVSLYVP